MKVLIETNFSEALTTNSILIMDKKFGKKRIATDY